MPALRFGCKIKNYEDNPTLFLFHTYDFGNNSRSNAEDRNGCFAGIGAVAQGELFGRALSVEHLARKRCAADERHD